MTNYSLLFFLLLSFVVFSCTNPIIYEKNVSISDMKWLHNEPVVFPLQVHKEFHIPTFHLHFRHNNNYEFSNIFLRVFNEREGYKTDTLMLEFSLAFPDGKWKGIGQNNVLSYSFPLNKMNFVSSVNQTITVQQFMRLDTLKNIIDVGLRVE